MTVLDRNFGVFNAATGITVTRSTGSYGSGTTIVVAIFGNIVFSTPSGWTQRLSNVASMGLYAYDRAGAGETSFAFTPSAAGSGVWFAWELSAGSTWDGGVVAESGNLTQVTTGNSVPTAGNRHMLAVCGGVDGSAKSITGFNNSFINVAGGQATSQDRPFASRAERDVVANGSTGYTTTATFSSATAVSAAMMMAYVDSTTGGSPTPGPVAATATIPAMGITSNVGTAQSLFTNQTPTAGNVSEGVPVTLATTLVFAKAGQVTGARFYAPATVGVGQIEAVLYRVDSADTPGPGTGTVLGTATFSALTPSSWNTVNFAAPIDVLASTAYRIAVRTSEGRYTATNNFFTSAPVVNGDITGIQGGDNATGIGQLGNGSYVTNNTGYPNQSFANSSYFVDVRFVAAAATPTVVSMSPVAAVASVPTAAVGGPPATIAMGLSRPVVTGGSVLLDAVVTPPGGGSIGTYLWEITAGGGSLTNSATSAATYVAPGSGTGTATVRLTVTTAAGASSSATLTVGYGSNIVAAENQLTGTARASWDLVSPNLGGVATLQGFLDGFSINKSETANFKIAQSDGAGWTAEVFRLGYYGGNGARSYGTVTPSGGQVTASQAQPSPADVDPDTTLISADCASWSTTLTWTPPSWAPSGMYILRMNRTGGGASHILFIVRDDARQADLMVMPSDSTWNAYNAWGGMGGSMYSGNSLYLGTAVNQYDADCARYVSYNRPVVNRGAADSGRAYGAVEWSTFFTSEYPMVRFLERNGINAKYYGCIDAAGDSSGIQLIGNGSTRGGTNAAMMIGHNEYWSDGMRSGWEAAVTAGVSIFTCASNEVFWRLVGASNDSSGRPRVWECYKSTIGSRGSTGRTQWTGTWRDPDGAGKGGNNPENNLTGTIFAVNGPDLRSMAVPFSGGFSGQPLWRHTSVASLTSGQTFTSPDQILGFEWDTYGPAGVTSQGGQFMAAPDPRTRYCSDATYAISNILLDDAGDVYTSGNATHRLVVKPGGGNALVFGTGTMNWAFGLDAANAYQVGTDNTSQPIQQATINMLTDMGAPAATLMGTLTQPTAVDWYVDVAMNAIVTSAGVTTFGVTAGANALITGVPVAGTASVPAPALSTGSSLGIATVTGTAAVPTAAVNVGARTAPGTAAALTAIGSPTLAAGSVVPLVVVAAASSVPFASAETGASADVSPAVVAAVTAVGVVAFRSAAGVQMVRVAALADVLVPGVVSGSATTVNLDDVEAVAAVGQPVFRSAAAVTPAAVGGTASVPTVSVRLGVVRALTVVSATASVPTPQISAQAGSGVGMVAVSGTASVPAATVRSSSTVAIQTATGQASVPTFAVAVTLSVRPNTVLATVSVWQPAIGTGSLVQMTAVLARATVPPPRLLMFPLLFAYPHQVIRTRGTHSITISRRSG